MNPFPMNQFKKIIPRQILDRGWEYFDSNRILEVSTETNLIKALVEGAEIYEVHIYLNKDQLVLDTECTCPYEQGEHCKHIAAVFYALEQSKVPSKASSLKQALLQKTKEELIEMILEIAKSYPIEHLKLTFQETDQVSIGSYLAKISQSISRQQCDDYELHVGFDIALDRAKDPDPFIAIKNHFQLLELCRDISYDLESSYIDFDEIYDNIMVSFGEVVTQILELSDINVTNQTFLILYKYLVPMSSALFMEFGEHLFYLAARFCVTSENQQLMKKLVITKRDEYKNNQTFSNILLSSLLQIEYQLISSFEDESAIWTFLNHHLDDFGFCRIAVEKLRNQKNTEKAIQVSLRAIQNRVGNETFWKELLYQLYEERHDLLKIRETALQLLLSGKFEYFEKWKQCFDKNQWTSIIEPFLEKMSSMSNPPYIYHKILIAKARIPELFVYCQRFPRQIFSLYPHFDSSYQEEMSKLFRPIIEFDFDGGSSEKQYKRSLPLLYQYKEACGREMVLQFIKDLRLKYPHRKALQRVLGQLEI